MADRGDFSEAMEKAPKSSDEVSEEMILDTIGFSMTSDGEIVFSEEAIDLFFEDVDKVDIYYDEDSNSALFKPSNNDTGYKIERTGSGGKIRLNEFLERFNLIPDGEVSFATLNIEGYPFVYLDLTLE